MSALFRPSSLFLLGFLAFFGHSVEAWMPPSLRALFTPQTQIMQTIPQPQNNNPAMHALLMRIHNEASQLRASGDFQSVGIHEALLDKTARRYGHSVDPATLAVMIKFAKDMAAQRQMIRASAAPVVYQERPAQNFLQDLVGLTSALPSLFPAFQGGIRGGMTAGRIWY